MKRFDLTSDDTCHSGCRIDAFDDGKWVKFEEVKKLVIKLTQDRTWNDPSIVPIEAEGCFIMLSDGEIKPALMVDGEWIKLTGYPYDFDFNKSDVIKWRYDLKHEA